MRYPTAILLLTLLLLGGCRKSDRNQDTDLSLAQDVANAQPALYEVFLATHEACLSTPGIKSFISCATISTDTLGMPRTMTVDFGPTGCTSPAGRTRSGKILVYQNGRYGQAGSWGSIYFDSFYINGYNYSGLLVVTALGSNTYKVAPDNLKVTAPDSTFTYILSGTYTTTQTGGLATLVADDDVFNLSGTMTITGRKGNTGTCTVDSGQFMVVNGSCAEPVSGSMTLTSTGQSPRKMNFGTGSCDQKVSVTANTVSSDLNISF